MNLYIGRQNGVSLIITFFIMIIILVIAISISTILYSELRVMRNMSNSMMGLYTADSGIEKVLYYDRQVRLISSTTACSIGSGCSTNQICSNGYCATVVSRGLCMMADSIHNADRYCQSDSSPASQGEHGIYCNGFTSSGNDCNPTTCSNCTISFDTSLGKKNYHVEAKIYPNGNFSNLEINSKGESGGAQRQIQILNVSQ